MSPGSSSWNETFFLTFISIVHCTKAIKRKDLARIYSAEVFLKLSFFAGDQVLLLAHSTLKFPRDLPCSTAKLSFIHLFR